jgi:hypothetical protein
LLVILWNGTSLQKPTCGEQWIGATSFDEYISLRIARENPARNWCSHKPSSRKENAVAVEFLRFIPTDPEYDPPLAAGQQAKELLASFVPKAAAIEVERYDTVNFVDNGENLEHIFCPACGAILEDGVWGDLVDRAYATQFANLAVTMPCCGAASSLNDLHYEWPVGFARFILEARDPEADVSQEQLCLLEHVLGCHLRKIWAHY